MNAAFIREAPGPTSRGRSLARPTGSSGAAGLCARGGFGVTGRRGVLRRRWPRRLVSGWTKPLTRQGFARGEVRGIGWATAKPLGYSPSDRLPPGESSVPVQRELGAGTVRLSN